MEVESESALSGNPDSTQKQRALVITEGKTDWQHLRRALGYFKSIGEYENLDVDFLEFADDTTMGDEKLAQMRETSPLLQLSRPLIFVFDRDNQKVIGRMSGNPGRFRKVADNVYSLCIPTPAHRQSYNNITIEMYYSDDDLRTRDPVTGKRLWFSNEIQVLKNPTSGASDYIALETPVAADEFRKWVFDQPADKINTLDGAAAGLSKSAFVSTILENAQLSASFDRTAFRAIFDILRSIIAPSTAA